MGLLPADDERELLAGVAGRDHQAFRVIYDNYGRKVYTYALQLLHSASEAEEMVQEVFLKLWLMGDRVLEIANLEAYLRTLTKHRSLNVLRRMVLEGKIEKALGKDWREETNDMEDEILIRDVRKVLNRAIDALPRQQREVYILCQQQGLKYEEAAERLGLSPLTVQTHVKRALRSVRSYVKDHADIAAILIILKLI
ncbi:RNA polymerase sigma-70 factor [Chitinophaga sp. XS-30]|uniref:RNA polymerase sigma-70 factor n=1 Tax=Chitinophaga sp. XS-30 TaxID=2604421 RepID=UPI0011DE0333|nr:RNA polymerase sigma-70 factor [Chitinophaga sp. XS-30]QEH43242.1 RNA polymerase sigma-70 factor [Chitinophaga sp. XS-30]